MKGTYITKYLYRALAWFLIAALSIGWQIIPFTPSEFIKPAHAAANMILLWDDINDNPGVPSGWTDAYSTYGDYFLKGEDVGNVGVTATPTHIHTSGTVAVTQSTTGSNFRSQKGSPSSSATHSHDTFTTFTMGTATIVPVFRYLTVLTYGGIPSSLDADLIALYDAAVPSGFTTYNSQNGYMIRGSTVSGSGGTGGSTTHQHADLTIVTSGSNAVNDANTGADGNVATDSHTHTYGGAGTWSPASSDHTPPHTETILATVDSGSTAIPRGMIAMFDGDPGEPWTVLSASGGDYYQQFIEGAASYQTGQGSATHTHALLVTSDNESITFAAGTGNPAATVATTHTHTISGNFSDVSNNPAYINVVVAQYNPPDLSWAVAADNFEVFESGSVGWNSGGTSKCKATLTDDNGGTATCTGSLAASTQYRVQVTLENNDADSPANMDPTSLDPVYHKNVIGASYWGGTEATGASLDDCAFYDAGSDDTGSPSCTIIVDGTTDAKITNTGAGSDVVLAAGGGIEGFSYLITTGDNAVTSSASYMDATIDEDTEDSSKIGITISSDTLEIVGPANVTLATDVHPGTTTSDYTFSTGEYVTVSDGTGSAWSLTVISDDFTSEGLDTIAASNIYLKTNADLTTEPTLSTPTTNLTETNFTDGSAIDTAKEILGGNTSADGDYAIRPTFFVIVPPTATVTDYTATFVFTVAWVNRVDILQKRRYA